MKPILYGYGLVWLGVAAAALGLAAYREILFRLAVRDLVREASEATESADEVMW